MNKITILIIRIIISVVVATLISMIFFNGIHPFKTPALAAGLLFFAYIFAQSRK